MPFFEDIVDILRQQQVTSKAELQKAKTVLCKKYGLEKIPSDSDILARLPEDLLDRDDILSLLRIKATRTISGVAIVAVMTSPAECPHGRCLPCPGGPTQQTPQSYTGYEPAAMRALSHGCDPFSQTESRLSQLQAIGHDTDKVDFIVMGGTFTARSPWYREWFVKRCFDAMNRRPSRTLRSALTRNETASSRCIGLTVETRPDWLRLHHIDDILSYGATRVELGVQSVNDAVLAAMKRGHTVTDTIRATATAKDAGLKVCYHLMPGLPGSTRADDAASFHTVFSDERFRPDSLKIYPTLVVEGSDLATDKSFRALTLKEATTLLADVKSMIPEWVRIQRIQRDIPVQRIKRGITKSNLRQLLADELRKTNRSCRCIRCREVGHAAAQDVSVDDLRLSSTQYTASGGEEVFLSLENASRTVLVGFLRLRLVATPHRPELQHAPCPVIRELRVLGREVPIGEPAGSSYQHRGFGRQLLQEAERVATETFDSKRLLVLSGVGVKPYYRRLGFADKGMYLEKHLH